VLAPLRDESGHPGTKKSRPRVEKLQDDRRVFEDRRRRFATTHGQRYKALMRPNLLAALLSVGTLQTDLRRREIPVNFMLPDDESLTGATFRCIPSAPLDARFVQFKVRNARVLDVTELEVLDAIGFEPFDLRIGLPDE